MKLTLNDIENIESQASLVNAFNENNAAIEEALENTLSRDGTSPNYMEADLDMNSNRILNLPAPQTSSEPARLQDLQDAVLSANDGNAVVPPVSGHANQYLFTDGVTVSWVAVVSGSGDMLKSENLSGLANYTTARNNLGLTSAATTAIGTSGATIPLLNGTNTWSSIQLNTAGATYSGTVEVRLSYTPATLSDDSAGFRGIPVNNQGGNYTFVLNDVGRMVRHTTGTHTFTIPPNSSVAYPVGATIVIRNVGTSLSIARGAGVVLRGVGSSTDTNFTLAQWGMATIVQEAANTWIIQGTGLS